MPRFHPTTVFACILCVLLAGITPLMGQTNSSAANPSRPSITNSPDLGPAGFLEIDFGAAGSWSGENFTSWATPLLVKYTFSKQWEVRLGTDGVGFSLSPQNKLTAPQNIAWWVQWVPSQAGADDIHWALGAGANAPFQDGKTAISTWSYTASLALAKLFSIVSWQSNMNVGTTAVDGEMVPLYGFTLLVSRPISEQWVPFVDGCFNFQNAEKLQPNHKLVVGTSYVATPQCVLDVAITVGLTQAFKGQTLQFGVSIIP